MTTYQPTGKGLCAQCGRDVGAHDAGHRLDLDHLRGECRECALPPEATVHDVGRVLRCPKHARSKSEYKRVKAQGGEILPPKQMPSRECVATTLTVAPDTDIYMPGWEPVSITKDDRGNALVLFRRTDLADDQIHDVPQVTNYDAEAEAKARAKEPAYVGPGDEVGWDRGDGFIRSGTVVGPRRNAKAQLAIHWFGAAGPVWKLVQDLRTPDGRPVAGFREGDREALLSEMDTTGRLREICAEKCKRIAELERELEKYTGWHEEAVRACHTLKRERDEARAELEGQGDGSDE